MIPGMNLLSEALSVIAPQAVKYYRFKSNTENEIGYDVPSFYPSIPVKGSMQPVPREKYEYLGLDMTKNYWNFYTVKNMQDLQRDIAGDQFDYCGKKYQCESKTDWTVDGWVAILAIEIGVAS